MGFLTFKKKGSFFLPRVMLAKKGFQNTSGPLKVVIGHRWGCVVSYLYTQKTMSGFGL